MNGKEVVLRGWEPGLKVVSLIDLLRDHCSRSLAEAKADVDRLLDGHEIRCLLPSEEDARTFEHDASALGARVVHEESLE